MKKILKFGIISCLVLTMFGCSNDDNESPLQEKSIIGTWKLIEIYNDSGDGNGRWNSVEDGYTYNFSANGEFTSTRFSECGNGNYSIVSNELSLDFDCEGFTAGIENPDGIFIELFTFESNYVILTPTYLTCIEGCGWKFKKINPLE